MAGSVVDRLRDRACTFPGDVAIIEGAEQWTFAELFDRVDRLSNAFHTMGLGKGDPVLAFLPNVHEAIECELAVLSSGLVWVTLTARLTWPEARGVVLTCRPRLVVTNSAGVRKIGAGLVEFPVDDLPPIVVIREGGVLHEALPRSIAYEDWIGAEKPTVRDVAIEPEDVARLRFTSGTTGTAKAAVLPHRVYHASLDNLVAELGPWKNSDRALHAAPLTHGSGAVVHPVMHAGGANVLRQDFDVAGVLEDIERHRITTMFTVPTMLSRLVSSPLFGACDVSSLRALIYGGAPMPEAQLRAATRTVGHALVHIYGMTEAPWPIALLKPADHAVDSARLRSVGKASGSCEIRIVDSRDKEAEPDTPGEIQVRGPNVMSGYLADETGTRAVLKDGWLSTGDIGKKDREGYVFIVGRMKDVIISGGFNVYAAEVESALSEHPAILEVAVVGLPHDDWGELVAAFVVAKPGMTLTVADIDGLARKRLSGYKCPRLVRFVDELPKNASGKIQKSEIVERTSAGSSDSGH